MTHNELIEKVAREICLVNGRMGDPLPIELQRVDRDWGRHIPAAKAAISTILAALQEPTEAMLDAGCKAWGVDINADETRENIANEWRQMLAASALGVQSE